MAFSSISFFVFFALVLIVMSLTGIRAFSNRRARHLILLAASYVFYGWWDWRFCFLMLALTAVAYVSALQIAKRPQSSKVYMFSGAAIPLAILGIFKYFNFFAASFTRAFGIRHAVSLNIILPVGISFYTFQSLSYTIDVYRKKTGAEKDFAKLALYIAFFPQLVAGPIVRASDFLPQLDEDRNISPDSFRTGIQIFAFGLFKKVVLADWLSVFVDDVFRAPAAFHAISLILAVIAYSMQIYFDFSGYSDMAVGCAKCLGYDFARNFNLPYISGNIAEFWRRWHISLSSWLKEYLYIPLGGNRKGSARTYFNNLITMLLGGLWHGANWTFIAWGGAHGLALCAHKMFAKLAAKKMSPSPPKNRDINRAAGLFRRFFASAATGTFVCFCWIFFRADSFSKAGTIILRILAWRDGIIQIYVWVPVSLTIMWAASIVAALEARKTGSKETAGFYPVLDLSKFRNLAAFFLFLGLTAGIAFTGANPFVYFQF